MASPFALSYVPSVWVIVQPSFPHPRSHNVNRQRYRASYRSAVQGLVVVLPSNVDSFINLALIWVIKLD